MYKDVLKPAIDEKLHAEQEPDNAVDEFAVKVVKKRQNTWPFTSRVLANFVVLYHTWRKYTHGSDWLQTFSCLSRTKIYRFMYPWISCTLNFWLQFSERKSGLYT